MKYAVILTQKLFSLTMNNLLAYIVNGRRSKSRQDACFRKRATLHIGEFGNLK